MLIKQSDLVEVISGRDKGQRGKVLYVDRAANKVLVEGLNRVYKHVKKSQRNPQGGRLSKESPIDASKVMVVCPKTGVPTRLGVRIAKDGSKERYAKKSGETLSKLSSPKKSANK